MDTLKEKLMGFLGGFGMVIFYLFSAILAWYPLYMIGAPAWLCIVATIAVVIYPAIIGFANVVLVPWAVIVNIPKEQDFWTILLYILAVVWFVFSFLPTVIKLIKIFKEG